MALTSQITFLTELREFQILPSEQLAETITQLQRQFPSSRALAQELLGRNWLTPFQANQLLAGQGKSLLLGLIGWSSGWGKAAPARCSRPNTS